MGPLATVLVLLFSVQQSFASPHFTPLRDDLTVPEKCREVELAHFSLPVEKFFVGRRGALAMGFTFEYPMSRANASILWSYFKALTDGQKKLHILAKIKADPELLRDYKIILANYQEQGFEFSNEGEILEVLAIEDLYREFPENFYFITGGIEYHRANSSMTLGEVDVFVGRRDDCSSVAVGEAKLGPALDKAKSQILRFEGFLIDHNLPPMLGEYQPRYGKKASQGPLPVAQ